MEFVVTYTETLSRTYIVEAEDWVEAEAIIEHLVDEGCIELDRDDDFVTGDCTSNLATDSDIDFYENVEDEFEYEMEMYREMLED